MVKNACGILYIYKWFILRLVLLFIHRVEYRILLVANKVDLVHLRVISEIEGRMLADRLQVPYVETSAKNPPQNIDATFHQVNIS